MKEAGRKSEPIAAGMAERVVKREASAHRRSQRAGRAVYGYAAGETIPQWLLDVWKRVDGVGFEAWPPKGAQR